MEGYWVGRLGWKVLALAALALGACARQPEPAPAGPPRVDHVLLITIDTLRADRVGAYGYARAATPALDSIARHGVRFDRAFASAPITQTSHATILTGRYPQGHGARHNGMRIDELVPTLAERFKAAGFSTAAFVAAFPLDRRFGLARGFDTYSDTMPRGPDGRELNERPGRVVVDEALAWLRNPSNPSNPSNPRTFLWVHLFEPHAPYVSGYDAEIAEADRQVARLLAAIDGRRARTLIVATSDHGEAFGEHGEIGHSIFVYDTTLRVPLLIEGPGVVPGRVVDQWDVGLVDLAPTMAARAGLGKLDADGADLSAQHLDQGPGHPVTYAARQYYAESFAPLLDFGWAPLRSVRAGPWKYIDAPRPELYAIDKDRDERENRAASERQELQHYVQQLTLIAGQGPGTRTSFDPDQRLAALGYVSRSAPASTGQGRADPKDKVKVAAAIARITSGEAQGTALERELRAVLAEDPGNPQMNLRLGHLLASSNRCGEARARFDAAIRARMPTADAHIGLASCQAAARQFDAAIRTLQEGERIERGNPLVRANVGMLLAQAGRHADAIAPLRDALTASPDLHQARFELAIALAELGRRDEARTEAGELLRRLPPSAPQRSEIERLLAVLRRP